MTCHDSTKLEVKLKGVLDRKWLQDTAREVGAVQRARKVDIVAFVWTLALGFGAGRERTIAAFRRAFEVATGVGLAPSAFYGRFTPCLVKLMRAAVDRVFGELGEPSESLGAMLRSFKDLVVTDATVVRLRDLLASAFPACRTNHTAAAAKLHVVMSVLGCGPRSVKITGERTHENNVLRVGKWVEGRLILFDLGYYDYQLFDCIRRNGGFFVSRLKQNANPLIVGTNIAWRGRAVSIVGHRLQDVLASLKRQVLDVQIQVRFRRRSYAGSRSWATGIFRLVAVYNQREKRYHLYVTNIPTARLTAEEVARVYACRWEIEMLFKEMKGFFGLDEVPSSKPEVVEALLLATVLTTAVSRTLLAAMRRALAHMNRRLPSRRFAAIFVTVSAMILQAITSPPRHARRLWQTLERFLATEAIDPNRTRKLNLDGICIP